jgi:hypothetical protein
MPTYKVSPFVNAGFQNYLFTAADLDEAGKIDITGTTGSVYTVHLDNSASTSATAHNWLLIWDGTATTTAEADVVIPVKHAERLTVWVDKGVTCNTAVSVAGSSVNRGGVATSGTMNATLFTD